MRKIKTFIDLLIMEIERDSFHKKNVYSSIYGKIIYPVAFNLLESKRRNAYYSFRREKYRYEMIR